jgi:hypothetical protein
MTWVALVGPQSEESLSLRSLAGSLARAGYRSGIVPLHTRHELEPALAAILAGPERPAVVGLALDCDQQAQLSLPLALALRQHGYIGHIAVAGRSASAVCSELLRQFAELDSVVRGQSEQTFVALVSALAGRRPLHGVPGLAIREGSSVVLTAAPELLERSSLSWPHPHAPPAMCFGRALAQLNVSGEGGCARDPAEVATQMVELQRLHGSEIFEFRDDSFFLPGKRKNLERIHALADALQRCGIGRFATLMRARAPDVDREVFRVLRDRLHTIRVDLTIENEPPTLRRWPRPSRKQHAIAIMRELDLFSGLNILAFDPNTTLHSLTADLDFVRQACDFPFHIGRMELHSGPPMPARMHDPEIERMFRLTDAAFRERDRLAGRILALRFDLEAWRHFQPARHERSWRAEAIAHTRALGDDSVRVLRCLSDCARHDASGSHAQRAIADVMRGMREVEAQIGVGVAELTDRVRSEAKRSRPPAFLGDRVVTPLQMVSR